MQSQTRLDDLMKKGIQETEPTTGRYFSVDLEREKTYACAVGAGEYGFSGDPWNGLSSELESVLTKPTIPFHHWPEKLRGKTSGAELSLRGVITKANDMTGMSREAIAEWVGWLIDEKGYDLYVEGETEVTQSCEKEPVKV